MLSEFIEQKLAVLIISDDCQLRDLVARSYQKQGLETILVSCLQPNLFTSLNIKVTQNNFYKIILIHGFAQAYNELSLSLIGWLDQQTVQTTYLLRASTPLAGDFKILTELHQNQRKEQQFFKKILNNSKNRVLIGQDVVTVKKYFSYPFKIGFLAKNNGYLIDADFEIYPQNQVSFFKIIEKELVKPEKKNFLVKGKVMMFSEFIHQFSLMYGQIYNKISPKIKLKIELATSLELVFADCELIVVVKPSSILDFVSFLVRDFPHLNLGVDSEFLKQVMIDHQVLKVTEESVLSSLGEPPRLPQTAPLNNLQQTASKNVSDSKNAANRSRKRSEKKNVVEPCLDTPSRQPIKNQSTADLSQKSDETPIPERKKKKRDEILDLQISRLFSQQRTQEKTARRVKKARVIKIIKKKSKRKQLIFAFGLIILFFGVSLALILGGVAINYRRSQTIFLSNLQKFNQLEGESLANLRLLQVQVGVASKIFDLALIDKAQDLISLNQNLIDFSQKYDRAISLRLDLWQQFLSQSASGATQISDLIVEVSDADRELFQIVALLQAEVQTHEASYLKPEIQQQLGANLTQIKQIKKQTTTWLQLDTQLEELLGLKSEKTYFLVLQDNQELRPTGGFIQAIAMIKVSKGIMTDRLVFNTNQLDGKVLGKLNAPPEIESLLGETELHLRDANWDPDFQYTAKKIDWFLKEALNQPVDGIIAFNYTTFQQLLKDIGPVVVANYDETIDANNLFDRLKYHANEEKEQLLVENFHVSLLDSWLSVFAQTPREKLASLNKTLYKEFEARQAIAYFPNAETQAAFEELGWSGKLINPECPVQFSQICTINSLYQVEANIGVNKVNPYVSRQVSHTIQIKDDEIIHQRQIHYVNKAYSQVWPLGTYKAYVRFYLDDGANIQTIKINEQPVPEEDILSYLDHNRQVAGVVIGVPPGEELDLSIFYSTQAEIGPDQSYFFYDQSQPGLTNISKTISLSFPDSLVASLVAPQADVDSNQLSVSSTDGDSFLVINF